MERPKLLDLYCKAGGCSKGYFDAGFQPIGVDIEQQKRYPYPFSRDNAINTLKLLIEGGAVVTDCGMELAIDDFTAIHASPPCQAYSIAGNITSHKRRKLHPDLVSETRELLMATGLPWVIENVPGSPLVSPVLVCGLALGCGVKRHRLFESSQFLFGTTCPKGHRGNFVSVSVSGHAVGERRRGWVTVCGGGAPKVADNRRRASVEVAAAAMGIDWMTRDELSQAIPPAYTKFIGKQLIGVSQCHANP